MVSLESLPRKFLLPNIYLSWDDHNVSLTLSTFEYNRFAPTVLQPSIQKLRCHLISQGLQGSRDTHTWQKREKVKGYESLNTDIYEKWKLVFPDGPINSNKSRLRHANNGPKDLKLSHCWAPELASRALLK